MSENPFEVLELPPSATEEEVVRQAARLAGRAADEASRTRFREAARQLTGDADERALWALLTHPGARHESPELERFRNAHRRPPASSAEAPPVPPPDREEVRHLLVAAVVAELAPALVALSPMGGEEAEEEIARQTAEAQWQGLVADPRG